MWSQHNDSVDILFHWLLKIKGVIGGWLGRSEETPEIITHNRSALNQTTNDDSIDPKEIEIKKQWGQNIDEGEANKYKRSITSLKRS